MQLEQAAGAQSDSQSHMHSHQAASGDSRQPGLQSGIQSEQIAGGSSMPDGMVQQEGAHEAVLAAEDRSSCSMTLVEAAALAASSPGAIVRVPTSTTLSQADQIALRYQNQVGSPTALPNGIAQPEVQLHLILTLHALGAWCSTYTMLVLHHLGRGNAAARHWYGLGVWLSADGLGTA